MLLRSFVTIQKFRPIALTNCSFKIFSKCVTTRLGVICEKLISPNQTAFIRGRYFLASVVSAHEIIHEVAHSSQAGFIFKLDYEKAYGLVLPVWLSSSGIYMKLLMRRMQLFLSCGMVIS